MFACLSGTPALLLEGIVRKAEQLVSLIASEAGAAEADAYVFHPVRQLLAHPKATAERIISLAHIGGKLPTPAGRAARAERVMPRLRRAAYSTFAPDRLAECLDLEAILPSTATMATHWAHSNFTAGRDGWMGWNTCSQTTELAASNRETETTKEIASQSRALYEKGVASRPRAARLEHFRDLHRGEDIYVVASGKSIDFFEKDFFDGLTIIGVNQVYKRLPNVTYLLRKEELDAAKLRNLIRELPQTTTHFLGRGSSGQDNWANAQLVFDAFGAEEKVVLFDHEAAWDVFSVKRRRVLPPATAAQLMISASTFATAVHLAAYMGARRIYLAGHDCGTLDGQVNFAGYHDEATLATWSDRRFKGKGPEYRKHLTSRYTSWLTGGGILGDLNIENDTIALKSLLRERYGVGVHSINPFINFGLEGHAYDRSKRHRAADSDE
jgi:hypothetical protein